MTAILKALILDFDGVLVESNDIKTEAFKTVFAEYPEHHRRMIDYHHRNMSLSRVEKFRYFIRECLDRGDDPALLKALLSAYSREVVDRVASCPATPGSLDFLEEFSAHLPLYLASVTPVEDLDWVLEKRSLKKYFREVFGDPPVPKKEAVVRVRVREKCRLEELLLIGDSEGDWTTARETGIGFIGYDSGMPLPPEAKKFSSWQRLAGHLRAALLLVC